MFLVDRREAGHDLEVAVRLTTTTVLFAAALALAAGVGTPVAAGQDAAAVKRGEELYAAQKCQVCHAVAGKGNKVNPLDGVGTKLTAEEIRQWIVNPVAMTAKAKSAKKPPMPAKWSSLPAADVDALVAYMQSLK
jgi:mono/diheme cytochrome c family protein